MTIQWVYVILVGLLIGLVGSFITTLINALLRWKFDTGMYFVLC